MIVVDTNVVAYLWLPGPHTAAAERLLREDPIWCVPLLCRSELRSVLSGFVRRRQLPLDAAISISSEVETHLRGHEYGVPSADVLRHAASSGCSAYDCEYVVLAESLGVPLTTMDRQVLAAFPRVARPLA